MEPTDLTLKDIKAEAHGGVVHPPRLSSSSPIWSDNKIKLNILWVGSFMMLMDNILHHLGCNIPCK